MRRVPRLRRPSAFLTSSQPVLAAHHHPICRSSTCLSQRDISTTPKRTFQSSPIWGVKLDKDTTPIGETPVGETPVEETPVEEVLQVKKPQINAAAVKTQRKLRYQPGIVPPEVTIALRANEIQDASYVPAESGLELEQVGGLKDWWEDPKHFGPTGKMSEPFGAKKKIQDAALLEVYTRLAVTEALAVLKEKAALITSSWAAIHPETFSTLQMGISVSKDGVATLTGNTKAVVENLRRKPAATGVIPKIELGEAKEMVTVWDNSWKNISLEDPRLKFAIAKRIQQLTGHRVPDIKLHQIKVVKNLIGTLVTPPKPNELAPTMIQQAARGLQQLTGKPIPSRNLHNFGHLKERVTALARQPKPTEMAQKIVQQNPLLALPNVKVHATRITPIEKETQVGRWKVIVRELEKRKLPVTGNGATGFRERKWIEGSEVLTFSKKPKRGSKSHRAPR